MGVPIRQKEKGGRRTLGLNPPKRKGSVPQLDPAVTWAACPEKTRTIGLNKRQVGRGRKSLCSGKTQRKVIDVRVRKM